MQIGWRAKRADEILRIGRTKFVLLYVSAPLRESIFFDTP
jgi:hypothetical protein